MLGGVLVVFGCEGGESRRHPAFRGVGHHYAEKARGRYLHRVLPPIARRFVAGETIPEALEHVRVLNERSVGGLVNLLGEHYTSYDDARADVQAYRTLIADIDRAGLNACISVKPSQVGLDMGEAIFRNHLRSVVECARDHGTFVWLDMEDHTTVDVTLDAFEDHVTEYPAMGVCVQANLKRTRRDLERLATLPGKVRLVKGAYDPPESIAYGSRHRVNQAYREDLEFVFQTYDGGIAVGSHDPEMVDVARHLHDEHGTEFEIQMLMGVREESQFELADGYPVYQYVPYGRKWPSYFYRRIAERKENAFFAFRAIIG